MITGAAPGTMDGVEDHAELLLAELARQEPGWRWWHLTRRARWFNAPYARRGPVRMAMPVYGWPGGIGAAIATLRALRPDVVHIQDQIHSFYETNAAVRLAEAVRCPVVVTLHEFHSELPSIVHTKELARRADVLTASDRRTADRCAAATGRTPDFVGWSPANVLPVGLSDSRIVGSKLVTFGYLNPLKRLEVVGEAIASLGRSDLTWDIVGPFDPVHQTWHAELQRALHYSFVRFTGALDDAALRRSLGDARLIMLPYADGSSVRRTSLGAAWAFGRPVITTPPAADEPEIVDGENCLFAEIDSATSWAKAIGRVLGDPALEQRLRAGSLATAERLGWKPLARRMLDLYQSVIDRAAIKAAPADTT